jgi:hypothetical protein
LISLLIHKKKSKNITSKISTEKIVNNSKSH